MFTGKGGTLAHVGLQIHTLYSWDSGQRVVRVEPTAAFPFFEILTIGENVKTQAELARRIRNAKPTDSEGRYDFASKVEVKAYLAEEVATATVFALEEITRRYEARIAELELSTWARIKRFFSRGGNMGLRNDNIRRVAAPPEFAAKYGSGKGPTEVV